MRRSLNERDSMNLHHAEGDGEAWLVSYADLITLLFGFFVVLYSFSAVDDKRAKEIGQEIAQALGSKEQKKKMVEETDFKAMESMAARQARALQTLLQMLKLDKTPDGGLKAIEAASRAQNADTAAQRLVQARVADLSQYLTTANSAKKQTMATMELEIPDKLLFEPGSARLKPASKKRLTDLGKALANLPPEFLIEVAGHTDSGKISNPKPFADNWGLSAARAGAVVTELINSGVGKTQVSAIGKADTEPLFPERDSGGRLITDNMQRNRRVQIIIRQRPMPALGE